MDLKSRIESILFVASDPVSFKKIAKVTGSSLSDVETAVEELCKKHNTGDSGINILTQDGQVQMVTNPNNSDVVNIFTNEEVKSDLTKAQLEALTVVAYRSPITQPELEEIRGVNCSRIIRNLKMRGLIVETDDSGKIMPVYKLSLDAMRHLGINSVKELPNYEEFSSHENIEELLQQHED